MPMPTERLSLSFTGFCYRSTSRVCFRDETWFGDRIESLGDRVVVSSCNV